MNILEYLSSSIGKKKLMGLTGLLLCGFLLLHMAENLLLLISPVGFNLWAHTLTSTPLIYLPEGGLLTLFLVHLGLAFLVTRENRLAKGSQYQVCASGDKSVTLASRTMILSGLLILVFLVFHLITFKYGPVYSTQHSGTEIRDLYKLVAEVFSDPVYVSGYIVCMLVLGMHVSHGFSAAFQSLGLLSSNNCTLKALTWIYTILVCGGFILQPVVLFLKKG